MNTNNVNAKIRRKHTEYLGMEYREGRSEAAAQLHALNREDHWTKVKEVGKPKEWIRVHKQSRKSLFRPSAFVKKVEVGDIRVTQGKFVHSGHSFKIFDDWRGSTTTDLPHLWVGRTWFQSPCR